jgi:hypothetical protein
VTAGECETGAVIIDDTGTALPPHPFSLARRVGCLAADLDIMVHAVRNLGFVYIAPLRGALLVKFEPSTVGHLAAIAAFYEIAARAPKRLILAYPGNPGEPDRYEIFHRLNEGLKRVEAAFEGRQPANRSAPLALRPAAAAPSRRVAAGGQPGQRGVVVSFWPPDRRLVEPATGSRSQRLCLPLDAISAEDEWLGRLLHMWRGARSGWRLPACESLDPFEVLNIARGRAHIVDTRETDPAGYRFRLWGAASSFARNHTNRTLAQMPVGSMREDALEDYWEVVSTGVPNYQLIHHVEKELLYSYARLLLPLSADGRRVDQLLVLFHERPLPELKRL